MFRAEDAKILNFMPNLKRFESCYIYDDENGSTQTYSEIVLNLKSLENFSTHHSAEQFIRMFNALPAGALRKISLINCNIPEGDVASKWFANQKGIKEVEATENHMKYLDLTRSKLTSLTIFSSNGEIEPIKGQDQIKSFRLELCAHLNIEKRYVEKISREMKALEKLSIQFGDCEQIFSGDELSQISGLQNLKSLDLSWHYFGFGADNPVSQINHALSTLKHGGLTELELYCRSKLDSLSFESLGSNVPQLKNLKVRSALSANQINVILGHFSNLEILDFETVSYPRYEKYVFKDGLVHEKLKSLKFKFDKIDGKPEKKFKDLPKLFACCKNLEKLQTSFCDDEKTLRNVLITQPNLRSLRLFIYFSYDKWGDVPKIFLVMSKGLVDVLLNEGKNLNHFEAYIKRFDDEITPASLKETFKNRFKYIDFCGTLCMMTNVDEEVKKFKRIIKREINFYCY